jgi:transcriptional regulator with XRE-family HTH domain
MDERTEFSRRLVAAMKQAGLRAISPTRLAIDFNLLHRGRPISTQAAHKWLNGMAIPAQDKLRTLAQWLQVSPAWLRYGTQEAAPVAHGVRQKLVAYQSLDDELLADFRRLSDGHRCAVRNLVAALLKLESDGEAAER